MTSLLTLINIGLPISGQVKQNINRRAFLPLVYIGKQTSATGPQLGKTSKFPHTNHKRSSVRSHTLAPTSICDLSHSLCRSPLTDLGDITSVTYVCHSLWFVCGHRKGILTSPLTAPVVKIVYTTTQLIPSSSAIGLQSHHTGKLYEEAFSYNCNSRETRSQQKKVITWLLHVTHTRKRDVTFDN